MTRSHLLLNKTRALAAVRYCILHDRHVLAAAFGNSNSLEGFVASIVTTLSNDTTPFGSLILTFPDNNEALQTDDLVAMIERGTSVPGIDATLAIIHGPPMEPTRPHAHVLVRFDSAVTAEKRRIETLRRFAGTIARKLDGNYFQESAPRTHGRRKARRDRANALSFDEWLLDVHHFSDLVLQARTIEEVSLLLQAYHLDYKLTPNGATVSTRSARPTFVKASALNLSPARLLSTYDALPTNLPSRYLFDYDRDKNSKFAPTIVSAWRSAHEIWDTLFGDDDRAQLSKIRAHYLPRYREIAKQERAEKRALGHISIEIEHIHRALLLDHHITEQTRAMSHPPKPHPQIGTWLRSLTDDSAPVAYAEGARLSTAAGPATWLPDAQLGNIKAWYDRHRRVATLDDHGRFTILAATLHDHKWSELAVTLDRALATNPRLSQTERSNLAALGRLTTMQPVAVSESVHQMLRRPYHFEPALQRTLLRANGFTWLSSTTYPDRIRELSWVTRPTPPSPIAGKSNPLNRGNLIRQSSGPAAPTDTTHVGVSNTLPPATDTFAPEIIETPSSVTPRFESADEAWAYIDKTHPPSPPHASGPLEMRNPNGVTDEELYTYLTPHPIKNLLEADADTLTPQARERLLAVVDRIDATSTEGKNIIVFFPPDPTPYRYYVRRDDDVDTAITYPLPLFDQALHHATPAWSERLTRYFDRLRKEREIIPIPLPHDIAEHYGIMQTKVPAIPIVHRTEAELYIIVANNQSLPERYLDPELADHCRTHGYEIGIETDDFAPEIQVTNEHVKSRLGRSLLRRKR